MRHRALMPAYLFTLQIYLLILERDRERVHAHMCEQREGAKREGERDTESEAGSTPGTEPGLDLRTLQS